MAQTTFFTQKASPPPQHNDLKEYYIPVFELTRALQQLSAWKYARNPRVSRMFYTSTNDLFTQEGLEAGRTAVCCYKVTLNADQMIELNQSKSIGKGQLMALSFMPKDILSWIELSENEQTEVPNPFYQTRETHSFESSMAVVLSA
jgi:hypothetical protein